MKIHFDISCTTFQLSHHINLFWWKDGHHKEFKITVYMYMPIEKTFLPLNESMDIGLQNKNQFFQQKILFLTTTGWCFPQRTMITTKRVVTVQLHTETDGGSMPVIPLIWMVFTTRNPQPRMLVWLGSTGEASLHGIRWNPPEWW